MNYPYLFQTVPDDRHGGPALWLGRLDWLGRAAHLPAWGSQRLTSAK